MIEEKDNIKNANIYGLVDSSTSAIEKYVPRLLFNDIDRSEKVLTYILRELKECEEFFFSVAFVAQSGVAVLIDLLKELEIKGVKGKIIASEYQFFTEPKALEKLLSFKNIDLRIITEDKAKMHTKGYLFRKKDGYTMIVGSSNLTQNGLCANKEWNIKLSSSFDGWLINNVLNEFNELLKISTIINNDWLEIYKKIYANKRIVSINANVLMSQIDEANPNNIPSVSPNKMQTQAIENLIELRKNPYSDKALIISSTGTGKTYLAAFDVKLVNPKKFLFVVHRETIAREAMSSFKKVLGNNKKMAVLAGGIYEEGDYIFATIQSLSKDAILNKFSRTYFDYIVVDEVHRAGAPSYQKIFNYFTPKFWLGMSATPERGDDFDIFKLFDYNIAYEIRLQDAMREQMICPFHYYGIAEMTVDGMSIDDKTSFKYLTCDERVSNIIEKANYYGYSGDRVKGLIFCSRIEEAAELSKKFNERGYKTVDLSGMNSQDDRERAIDLLESDDPNNRVDYIFSVDIFNEGVDIPPVNQIIMLRPTQSAIIFVQQLGRGLRISSNKEYLVVIDFIGNYENNFLIPIALSGDKTFNKDTIRRYVGEGSNLIPGSSTISFDRIAKRKIYEAIDKARFSRSRFIYEAYLALKRRLGKVPLLHEFDVYGAIDIMRIIDLNDSYYSFLVKYDPEALSQKLSKMEIDYIDFISSEYLCGKRPHELELLNIIINKNGAVLPELRKLLFSKYPTIKYNYNTETSLINQMSQNFKSGSAAEKYKKCVLIEKIGAEYFISKQLAALLKNECFKTIFQEIIDVGLDRYQKYYGIPYEQYSFKLYEKYTYDDVMRGLDWEKLQVSLNIGGYKYDEKTNTLPVFINYEKSEEISSSIKYEDRFISSNELIAISKSNRSIDSVDIKRIKASSNNKTDILLFVRKNKDDNISKEFYFLGKIEPSGKYEEVMMPGTDGSLAVEIHYRLKVPVRDDIMDYFLTVE